MEDAEKIDKLKKAFASFEIKFWIADLNIVYN